MRVSSEVGAVRNARKNEEMLRFAKYNLKIDLQQKIYKSYRWAKWSQLSLLIIFLIVVFLQFVFIPSENVPNGYADFKTALISMEAALFVVLIFPIWLVICNYTFGNNWRKYVKWYNRSSTVEELYDMFDMKNN